MLINNNQDGVNKFKNVNFRYLNDLLIIDSHRYNQMDVIEKVWHNSRIEISLCCT